MGPKMLPWGTPLLIGSELLISDYSIEHFDIDQIDMTETILVCH